MPFQQHEMPVASGMLKNSRLARSVVYFDGGVHDLSVQPAPVPAKTALASVRFLR
jgi:hypothetical protein